MRKNIPRKNGLKWSKWPKNGQEIVYYGIQFEFFSSIRCVLFQIWDRFQIDFSIQNCRSGIHLVEFLSIRWRFGWTPGIQWILSCFRMTDTGVFKRTPPQFCVIMYKKLGSIKYIFYNEKFLILGNSLVNFRTKHTPMLVGTTSW